MDSNLITLESCPLFAGIQPDEIESLLICMNASSRPVKKDEVVFAAGAKPDYVGIVLSGSVYIIKEDYWGNRVILADVQPGGIFGETFSCAEAESLPVSSVAHEEGVVMMVDCMRILSTCSSICSFHIGLIRNLMKTLANKNIFLTQKIDHLTKKTTREKVLSYLSECALSAGSNTFSIPFNRQELADYLSVERSALSYTLSKMRETGEIRSEKNRFWLLKENN